MAAGRPRRACRRSDARRPARIARIVSQAIEQRPRHPMASARLTDIAQPLGVAQDAKALSVYAVLEGHRSTPFHVSPPRETRGRTGRLALLSSLRSDDRH
jgi:hypothetical protein